MCSCTSVATDDHTSFVILVVALSLHMLYSGTPIIWTPFGTRNVSWLYIGVFSFPGEVTLVELIIGTFKSVHIVEVFTFQGCPQDRVPLYRLYVLCCYVYKITTTRAVYDHTTSELGTPLYKWQVAGYAPMVSATIGRFHWLYNLYAVPYNVYLYDNM